MPTTKPTSAAEALGRQKRLLVFGGIILAAQLVNTVVLWRLEGRLPLWSLLAFLGVGIFYAVLLRQYLRLRSLPPAPPEPPGKRRKRLRDPHRKGK